MYSAQRENNNNVGRRMLAIAGHLYNCQMVRSIGSVGLLVCTELSTNCSIEQITSHLFTTIWVEKDP